MGTHIKAVTKHDEVTNHVLQVFVGGQIRQKGLLNEDEIKTQSVVQKQENVPQSSYEGKEMVLSVMQTLSQRG